jgi:hypothetical protein
VKSRHTASLLTVKVHIEEVALEEGEEEELPSPLRANNNNSVALVQE